MEDFFDEDFYEIQYQISQIDPELVLIDEKWQKRKGEILHDLVLQIKLYGSKVIDDSKQKKYSTGRSSLRQQLSPFINGEKIFGQQNGKVDWKETVQTLEEGFDSAENLLGSCEILQFLDYDIDIKSFLNIKLPSEKADFMSIAEMQQKVIHWLGISNRIKDKSAQLLLGEQQTEELKKKSFFETVMLIEDKMVMENNREIHHQIEENKLMQTRLQQINIKLRELQEKNIIIQQSKEQYQDQNIKLSQDIEELLEEFALHKKKHEAICEEFQTLEGQNNLLKLDIQNLNQQISILKDKNEFAEELEEIERLNQIITERDQQIVQIELNFQLIRGKLIQLLNKDENKTVWQLSQNPENQLEEISSLINQLQFQQNSKESKSIQTNNEDCYSLFYDEFKSNINKLYQSSNELINALKSESNDKIKILNNIQQILYQIDALDQLYYINLQKNRQSPQRYLPFQTTQQNLLETIKLNQRTAQEELLIIKKLENYENQNQRLKKLLEEQQQALDYRELKQKYKNKLYLKIILSEIEIHIKSFQNQLDNIKSENKLLQSRNTELEKDLSLKDQNYSQSQIETHKIINDLKSQVVKKQNEMKLLHRNYQANIEQNEILEQKIRELQEEREIETLNQLRKCQTLQFQYVNSQIRDREVQLMNEKNILKGELDRTCQKIQELEGSINRQKNDKENLIFMSQGSDATQNSEVNLQKIIKNQEDEIQRLNDMVSKNNIKKYRAQREIIK